MSKEAWNARFGSTPEYIYGTEPNVFFKEQIDKLETGKLLLPAEGEGRNAVYAASRGWEVTAFDISEEGMKKALKLAEEKNVSIKYLLGDINEMEFPEAHFDAIALIYAHQPPEKRRLLHANMFRFLRPGGTLFIEGFSKDQVNYSSGGPSDPALLYSIKELSSDFNTFTECHAEPVLGNLDEGPFHKGPCALVRLIGKK